MASSETSNLSRIKLALQKSIDANKKANLKIKSDEDYFLGKSTDKNERIILHVKSFLRYQSVL